MSEAPILILLAASTASPEGANIARGPEGFDERLLRRVERIDGVRAAAPILQTPVNLVGPRGARSVTLLAADTRLARLGGDLLRGYVTGRLAGLHAGLLPAPISDSLGTQFGESISVQVHGRTATVPVGAVVDRGDVHEAHAVVEAVARVPQAGRGGGAQLPEHRFHQLLVLVGPLGAGPVLDDGDGHGRLPFGNGAVTVTQRLRRTGPQRRGCARLSGC